jgi:hypothetical protein
MGLVGCQHSAPDIPVCGPGTRAANDNWGLVWLDHDPFQMHPPRDGHHNVHQARTHSLRILVIAMKGAAVHDPDWFRSGHLLSY